MNDTVVLGEASESDSDEISLNSQETVPSKDTNVPQQSSHPSIEDAATQQQSQSQSSLPKSGFKSILSVIAPSNEPLSRLINSSSSLLLSTSQSSSSLSKLPKQEQAGTINDDSRFPSLLHKTLYSKNAQLYHSLVFIYNYPYIKASKDLNSISQKLVESQKIIQESDSAMQKLRRECSNLRLKIDLITWSSTSKLFKRLPDISMQRIRSLHRWN